MAKSPTSKLIISLALDSKGIQTGMNRVSAQTGKMSKSARSGTRATAALGSALKTAAFAAGGAAAAYLSIAQAKAAIQTTQDLALVTAGLNRNLGISTKEASRWAAVTRARGVDSKTMTLSFTSLARAIEGVGTGSESALRPFQALGITQKELTATGGNFSKQVLLIADALGEAEGSSTRQAAAAKLLGRGYQSLLPMFTEGSKGLQEQLRWADEFGATMGTDTVKAMGDFTTAQRKTKVAMMGLQITFAKYATPAIADALGWVQKFVKVLNDPNLTAAKRTAIIRKQFRDLSDDVLKVVSDLGPEIAQTAGQLGVIMARSLAKAFVETGFLGKVAISALLLRSLGGPAAIIAAGRGAGVLMGQGMAAGASTAGTYGLARSFGRGRLMSTVAAVGAPIMASGLAKSLARAIPFAMGAVAIGDVLLTAISGDMKSAAVKGGAAAIGGAIGFAFGGPVGAAIGAGLGTIGAGLISPLFDGAEAEAAKRSVSLAQQVKNSMARAAQQGGNVNRFAGARQGVQDLVSQSRRAQARASDRLQQAEAKLSAARRRFGADSRQAAAAERELARAKRGVARANDEVRNSERVRGIVRDGLAAGLRSQAIEEKRGILILRQSIKANARQIVTMRNRGASNAEIAQKTEVLTRKQGQLRTSEARLQKIFAQGGQQIGPKYEKSLRRSADAFTSLQGKTQRTYDFLKPLQQKLGDSITTFGRRAVAANRKAGGAAQQLGPTVSTAYSGIVNNTNAMAEALGSDQRISIDFGKPQGRRRGGPITGSGKQVPVAVSPGEMISWKGSETYVPGRPEPRDSVLMFLPVGAKVFTTDGQHRLAQGSSETEALRRQSPHFATGGKVGGIPKPRLSGGGYAMRGIGQAGVDRTHSAAEKWIGRLKPSLQGMEKLAAKFGLQTTSGYRAGDDGYHGVNRARDFSNSDGPTPQMLKFAKFVGGNFGRQLLELIYTPLGWAIKNGARTAPYAADDHYDHVHVALRNGGKVTAKSPLKNKKQWGPNQLHTLASAVGMKNPALMTQVAQAESGGNAKLNNAGLNSDGSVDYGLWQINSVHGKPVSGMMNPIQNAFYAREILNSQGIGAWSAYNNGRYSGFSGGRFDQEFFWDLVHSDKSQKTAKRSANRRAGRVGDLWKLYGEKGGGPGTPDRIRKAGKAARAAVRLARKGNVGGARKAGRRATGLTKAALGTIGGGRDEDQNRSGGGGSPISGVSYLSLPPSVRESLPFEDKVALLERDLAVAATTAGTGDDLAVLNQKIGIFTGLRRGSAKTIAKTSRRLLGFTKEKLEKARRDASAKGKSKAARERRRAGRAYIATYNRLNTQRSTAIGNLGRAESEIASATEAKGEISGTTDLATAMAELATAIREQNEIAQGVQATSSREAFRMLSDVISGQIVGKRISPSTTPQGVRY